MPTLLAAGSKQPHPPPPPDYCHSPITAFLLLYFLPTFYPLCRSQTVSQLHSKTLRCLPISHRTKANTLTMAHCPLTSTPGAIPLVHSASVSLASLIFLKHIWLRTLALTVLSACKTLPREAVCLISLSPGSLSSGLTSQGGLSPSPCLIP